MNKSIVFLLLAVMLMAQVGFKAINDIPEGWFKAGSAPDKYEMGIDDKVVQDGTHSAYILSIQDQINGFGTLMQTCSAKDYLGKRIKMTGYLKAENVDGWAGLWLRIDGRNYEQLGIDNMHDRAISGTTDWIKCELVLDVPNSSHTLNFGALLSGTGKIWFDNLTFEEIASDALPTGKPRILDRPTNTSFDKH